MKANEIFYSPRARFVGLAIILLVLICISYSNHFSNGFEFDDYGSIVNNTYIRDIKNLPLFFIDIKYFGTNMYDLGYRPVVAALNAIDCWIAGGLKPVYFHAHIFISYLVLLVLLFYLFIKIFGAAADDKRIGTAALLGTAFYGLHAANAETINYIISRSDSFSTLCIAATILLYTMPFARKYYLYLITIILGIGTKETGVMGAPILFFYILFFEEDVSLVELATFKKAQAIFKALKKSLPALLVSFGLFLFVQLFLVQGGPTAHGARPDWWQYFYTQWFVIAHYIGNFILPLDLSVDPDFALFTTVINQKVLLGLALILGLLVIACVSSVGKETRPISFGILWYFIALAPTSSIYPFYQIANDHRAFFPYIGLAMAVSWALFLLFRKYEQTIQASKALRAAIVVVIALILASHAYGTYQRNRVWSTYETLWHDAAVKSPNNGRALMNYGLALMAAGKYDETLTYFKRTLEGSPTWATIHINMGVLRSAMGFPHEAETYFKNAINYQPYYPDSYYYYARWLIKAGRIDEAALQLEAGNKISPGYAPIIELLAFMRQGDRGEPRYKAILGQSPADLINLSMQYYRTGYFQECIRTAEAALRLRPDDAAAYNNICASWNALGEWDKAVAAGERAVALDPGSALASNNLAWAMSRAGGH